MHEGRDDGRDDDGLVRHTQEFDHQEGRRAHDGRRDLAAGGGRGFDRAREMARIAHTDHGRDGQRTHRDRIGDRRARQHAEHGRTEHADLGRAAGIPAGDRRSDVEEQLAEADARGEHTEQDEMENISRHHADRHAINALAREVHVVDELRPAGARMLEQARKDRPGERVGDEDQGDDRQRPTHAAASGFKHQDDQDGPHDHIEQQRIADPEREVVEHIGDVQHRDRDRGPEQPIEQRHAARAQPGAAARLRIAALAGREHQEDQAEHESQVHAAVRGFAQQPEAGRVVMEERERDQQHLHDHRGRRHGRSKTHLGIELLLEFLQALGIDFSGGGGHGGVQYDKKYRSKGKRHARWGHAVSVWLQITSAGRFPCRTWRHPDGRGCRRSSRRFPW